MAGERPASSRLGSWAGEARLSAVPRARSRFPAKAPCGLLPCLAGLRAPLRPLPAPSAAERPLLPCWLELRAPLRPFPPPSAAERPGQRLYAEEQWELACEFDQRYADADWVARTKHWPPRALAALQRFLQLK